MAIDAISVLEAFAGYAKARGGTDAASRPPLLGTIDPDYTSGSPRVTFDGESTMSTKLYPYLESYQPRPGDRVLLTPIGASYMIVGAISAGAASTVPIGSVEMFAGEGSAIPAGWLVCNGSAISRDGYSELFAVIGTTWGVGDGSTTFNLPDMQGRVPVGAGEGAGLTSRLLASSGGTEAHTSVVWHGHFMPSHTHTAPDHMHQGPSHTHSISSTSTSYSNDTSHYHTTPIVERQQSTNTGGGPTGYTVTGASGYTGSANAPHYHWFSGSTNAGGTGWTTQNGATATSSGGAGYTTYEGDVAVDHMPPFATLIYIIKY